MILARRWLVGLERRRVESRASDVVRTIDMRYRVGSCVKHGYVYILAIVVAITIVVAVRCRLLILRLEKNEFNRIIDIVVAAVDLLLLKHLLLSNELLV